MDDRLIILAPALVLVLLFLSAFAVYCILCAVGRTPRIDGLKHNEFFGLFYARFLAWLMSPVERVLIGRVSANAITVVSLASCLLGGVMVGTGRLATGAWLYILAGLLDVLDGRLARASAQQSRAGALFDSVADRWGELALFAGYAWYLRDTAWLLAVMLAVAGSMMVSYTRARGEGLGLELRGGVMQRAERVALVSIGTIVAAWLAQAPTTLTYAKASLGWSLLVCGAAASITAVGRWLEGYRALTNPRPVSAEVRRVSGSREVPQVQRGPSAVRGG